MKKLFYIVCLILIWGCDKENSNNCFRGSGAIIQEEFTVSEFSKIVVNKDIELVIKEGPEHKVVVETGKNLLGDIDVLVADGKLTLTNNNNCNFVREYGITKIHVTAPNIIEIRSSTQFDISSDGILTYPNLSVLSEDWGVPGSYVVGDFRLQINNESFGLVFNNLSSCHISGKTNNLNIFFASGEGRFEGGGLIAQNVVVNHRGTNDMIVNPQQSLKGALHSYGDVISKNEPLMVEVDILFRGQLIFE